QAVADTSGGRRRPEPRAQAARARVLREPAAAALPGLGPLRPARRAGARAVLAPRATTAGLGEDRGPLARRRRRDVVGGQRHELLVGGVVELHQTRGLTSNCVLEQVAGETSVAEAPLARAGAEERLQLGASRVVALVPVLRAQARED